MRIYKDLKLNRSNKSKDIYNILDNFWACFIFCYWIHLTIRSDSLPFFTDWCKKILPNRYSQKSTSSLFSSIINAISNMKNIHYSFISYLRNWFSFVHGLINKLKGISAIDWVFKISTEPNNIWCSDLDFSGSVSIFIIESKHSCWLSYFKGTSYYEYWILVQ